MFITFWLQSYSKSLNPSQQTPHYFSSKMKILKKHLLSRRPETRIYDFSFCIYVFAISYIRDYNPLLIEVKSVTHTLLLGLQISLVVGVGLHFNGDILHNLEAVGFEPHTLDGIVGQETDFVYTKLT